MRAVLAVLALASSVGVTGCAELGVVTDGTSVSYGKPSRGYLIDGVKLPDKGDGFTTRETWAQRGNRYGTDELVDLLKAVARRMRVKSRDVRLVIADLSSNGGGAAHLFHRSHQTGRDVDLLYYMRDADGQPFEADSMRVFGKNLVAKDKSGITVDVPRTWQLVRELLTAPEATVQYIFMYQPVAERLIEYAQSINEDPVIIARAAKACRQPGDSAPHNDHMHVRIYCAAEDRQFGCIDMGPLELLAEREAERQNTLHAIADALPRGIDDPNAETAAQVWAGTTPPATASQPPAVASQPPAVASQPPAVASQPPAVATQPRPGAGEATSSLPAIVSDRSNASSMPSASFSSLLRARADRIDLRGWR